MASPLQINFSYVESFYSFNRFRSISLCLDGLFLKLWKKLSSTVSKLVNIVISLIIHEEKTKEISGMTVVVYLIQNFADLHKL